MRLLAHLPLAALALDLLQTGRFHRMWRSTALYHFHWGFEKVKSRYR